MGKHKASNAAGLRLASYLGDWRMAAHLPNEPNGSVPAGPFGEQQIGTRGPAWKSEELWSPRDRATWRPEEIPEGRMRRVNDGKGHNPELAARDGLNPDLAPERGGQPPDLGNQLSSTVRDQPGIQVSRRH